MRRRRQVVRGKTSFNGESLLSHTQWPNQIVVGAFIKIIHYEHEQRTGEHPPTHYFFFSMTSNRQRRPYSICRGKNVMHKRFFDSVLILLRKTKKNDVKFKTFIKKVFGVEQKSLLSAH